MSCHDSAIKKGRLDLAALKFDPSDAANRSVWIKVHDRVKAGEMPPGRTRTRPDAMPGGIGFIDGLGAGSIAAAERATLAGEGRSIQRRLNRHEYENALRDLLGVPAASRSPAACPSRSAKAITSTKSAAEGVRCVLPSDRAVHDLGGLRAMRQAMAVASPAVGEGDAAAVLPVTSRSMRRRWAAREMDPVRSIVASACSTSHAQPDVAPAAHWRRAPRRRAIARRSWSRRASFSDAGGCWASGAPVPCAVQARLSGYTIWVRGWWRAMVLTRARVPRSAGVSHASGTARTWTKSTPARAQRADRR